MYICESCGAAFAEARTYYEPHGEQYSACPYCGGSYDDADICSGCGQWYLPGAEHNGYCPACNRDIDRRLAATFSPGELEALRERFQYAC